MLDIDQRRLLGDFIRAHRERARPAITGGRRRTPGLRREELAALAGISLTWCAWLEQGREVQASPEALSRLAQAVSLTRAERAYLFELAGRLDPERLIDTVEDAPPSLVAAVNAVKLPLTGWTGSGMPAAGTRPRRGYSRAGSTAIISAICCGLFSWKTVRAS